MLICLLNSQVYAFLDQGHQEYIFCLVVSIDFHTKFLKVFSFNELLIAQKTKKNFPCCHKGIICILLISMDNALEVKIFLPLFQIDKSL